MRASLVKATKWAASFIVVLTCIFVVGPKVEEKLFPPFVHVKAAVTDVTANHIDIIVTGVKDRRCMLLSAMGESMISNKRVISQVQLLKPDGTPLEIADQRIGVGAPFVRRARVSPGGDNMRVIIEAQCHPFWTVSQVMVNTQP